MKKPKRLTKKPRRPKDEYTTEPLEGGSGKGPFPPDSSDLRRRIEKNPDEVAAEAKNKLHEAQAGYQGELYTVLAMAVGLGRHYFNNYKPWRTFFSRPFFQAGKRKPKARTHHQHALRHTLNFIFDANSKQLRNRTGKYAAALHEYMLIGVPVDLIAEHIKKDGGIEKLYEAYLEREAHKPAKKQRQARSAEDYTATMQYCNLDNDKVGAPKDMTYKDLEDGGEPVEDDGHDLDLDSRGGEEKEDPLDIYRDLDFELEPTVRRGADPEGRPTIELEMKGEWQGRFLNLEKGQRAVVDVECLGDTDDGWQRLRAKKVRWLKLKS